MVVTFELGTALLGLERLFSPETFKLRDQCLKIRIALCKFSEAVNFVVEEHSDNKDNFLRQCNADVIFELSYHAVKFVKFFEIPQHNFLHLLGQQPILVYQLLHLILYLLPKMSQVSPSEKTAVLDRLHLDLSDCRPQVYQQRPGQPFSIGRVKVAVDAQIKRRRELSDLVSRRDD